MKLAIITSGFLPIPATKGGAVENLIVNFMNNNEENKYCDITVFSDYDDKALKESKKYKSTNVIFIKSNMIVSLIDRVIFFLAKNILKKPNSHSYRFIVKRLHFLRKVSKYLKKYDYDRLLLENHPTQYLSLKWNKNYIKYSGRYYYHCHNEFPGTYGCKDIIRNTKKFICVSKFRKNNVREYLDLKEEKFLVVRNGIDSKKIYREVKEAEKNELLLKYNIKNDEKILIFTGRIVPGKGIKELLEAIKLTKNNNFKLLILGSSLNDIKEKTQYQIEIEKIVDTIKDKVIFTGFVNYEELYKYYSVANIAVLPSMLEDSAPLTIIESLVCGLPIITTYSGGIPEYVNKKCSIILQRDKNLVKNIASSIDELLNDDLKCAEMSKESFRISKELTLEKYCKNLVNAINGD